MSRAPGDPTPTREQGARPAPPIKPATWEWYIPIYFWLGGIAAGSWLVATAADPARAADRRAIRAARYLSLAAVLGGTPLLIADLGRPERFLNMLRIVRRRSAMSLGSWALALFGGFTGLAALLQAAEDGLFGDRRWLARASRGKVGRTIHLAGLPAALFVGGYGGVLLGSTSTPSWARRTRILGPLFLASATSSGLAAVSAVLESRGESSRSFRRRSSQAETAALAAELGLAAGSEYLASRFPSKQLAPPVERLARTLMLVSGMGLPLARSIAELLPATRNQRSRRRRRQRIALAGLALTGSLTLRFLTFQEGLRSARTGADTWKFTARDTGNGREW